MIVFFLKFKSLYITLKNVQNLAQDKLQIKCLNRRKCRLHFLDGFFFALCAKIRPDPTGNHKNIELGSRVIYLLVSVSFHFHSVKLYEFFLQVVYVNKSQ